MNKTILVWSVFTEREAKTFWRVRLRIAMIGKIIDCTTKRIIEGHRVVQNKVVIA
jgi:hypothetical protein